MCILFATRYLILKLWESIISTHITILDIKFLMTNWKLWAQIVFKCLKFFSYIIFFKTISPPPPPVLAATVPTTYLEKAPDFRRNTDNTAYSLWCKLFQPFLRPCLTCYNEDFFSMTNWHYLSHHILIILS